MGERTQPPPFHPEKLVTILENPALNATEDAVVVIIKCGGDFCGSNIRIVEVPTYYLLPLVTGAGIGENACFVTGRISGTWPGSKKAYAAPLKVVPMSRARTSFREDPE